MSELNEERQAAGEAVRVANDSVERASQAEVDDEAVEREMDRLSRRSFLWGAAATAAGLGGFAWLKTRRLDDGIQWPLRRVLEVNEQFARDYFSRARLAPTFAPALAREPRANGDLGLADEVDVASWRLRLQGAAESGNGDSAEGAGSATADPASDEAQPVPALELTLDQIKALPRVELVTQLKCIEGWSTVVAWAGVRLADFIAKWPPPTRDGNPPDPFRRPEDLPRYISLATPDNGYYVGLELESALHPQTLLCFEMNGAPLTAEHGAPLRLVIPVKYGIKNIKQIGTIRYTDRRPADYWAEQGYDWYAGH